MKISSRAFEDKQDIPPVYTCDGKDLSPPLDIEDVPQAAKSLVLIMDDPDVPAWVRKDGLYVHWVVYDIPPTTTSFPENGPVPGTPGIGTGGKIGYDGPCPPDRKHRYFFKLYALDTLLLLPPGISKETVEAAMQGHVLAEATLMANYVRLTS